MLTNKYYKIEEKKIPSQNGEIEILIIKPTKNAKSKEETPGILWMHGGGYVTGMTKMIYFSRAINLVKKYGAVVITPEYRLAPKYPYPAALEDCYTTLKYIKDNAEELGINDSQIMVGGESAGGGLTAALCMYARDRGEVNIAFQMPLYPMLDCEDTESSKNNKSPVWDTKRNHIAWKAYLGDLHGKEVPAYASPARQKDYSNLYSHAENMNYEYSTKLKSLNYVEDKNFVLERENNELRNKLGKFVRPYTFKYNC